MLAKSICVVVIFLIDDEDYQLVTIMRGSQKLLETIFFLFTSLHLHKDCSVHIIYEPLSYGQYLIFGCNAALA